MRRLWLHARKFWARWAWGCLMLLLTNACAMAVPQLFRFAVDGIQGGAPISDLRAMALTLVLIAVGGAVFRVSASPGPAGAATGAVRM